MVFAYPKSLWSMKDWKGNYKRKKPVRHPTIDGFQSFFEDLYASRDTKEISNISSLQSNVTIPILDDPIAEHEVDEAMKSMNNGGFGYSLSILLILTSCFSNTILLLLNLSS